MTDDIRHLLSAYAATTPDLDPSEGLSARIVRHQRRRHATVAGIACFAAVVAGTGAGVLTRRGDDRDRLLPAASPTAEPTVTASGDPSAAPTVSPTATPTRAGGTPVADETPHGGATATADPGRPVSTAPITREAKGTDGLRVRVTLSPGSVATATFTSVRIQVTDDDGQARASALSWGDGTGEPTKEPPARSCTSSRVPTLSPQPHQKSPSSLDETYRHAFRRPGSLSLMVEVSSNDPCDSRVRSERVVVEFPFTVTAGRVTSNGPELAMIEDATMLKAGGEREYTVMARAGDIDGYMRSITVDWGDGSAPQTFRNDEACDDDGGRRYPWLMWFELERNHTYPREGDYTITITSASAGCDGRDVDPASARTYVSVG